MLVACVHLPAAINRNLEGARKWEDVQKPIQTSLGEKQKINLFVLNNTEMQYTFSLIKAVSLTLQDARKAVCDTSLNQVCYFININWDFCVRLCKFLVSSSVAVRLFEVCGRQFILMQTLVYVVNNNFKILYSGSNIFLKLWSLSQDTWKSVGLFTKFMFLVLTLRYTHCACIL